MGFESILLLYAKIAGNAFLIQSILMTTQFPCYNVTYNFCKIDRSHLLNAEFEKNQCKKIIKAELLEHDICNDLY